MAKPPLLMKPKPPELYYDAAAGYLLRGPCGRFVRLDQKDVHRHLLADGHTFPTPPAGLSGFETLLVETQRQRAVDYAGPLAGHRVGLLMHGSRRVLVTHECAAFTAPAKPGKLTHWTRFLDELLGKEQSGWFLDWLSIAYRSLIAGDFRPGQMVVLAGPVCCGKSFLQYLVTLVLGGRAANPYLYMTGGTTFNAHVAEAEHLAIEDQHAATDIRSRRKFGSSVKEFTVNTELCVHPKGRQALNLPTFRRLTLSVNDEPENLLILPPLDASVSDKVALLKCGMASLSEDRAENVRRFTAELPAVRAMLARRQIPAARRDNRFGVVTHHNSDLLSAVSDLEHHERLLSIVDDVLWRREDIAHAIWSGTTEEMERTLRQSEFGFAVEKLLHFPTACGVYLARLARKHPDRITSVKKRGRTHWRVSRPSDEDEPA